MTMQLNVAAISNAIYHNINLADIGLHAAIAGQCDNGTLAHQFEAIKTNLDQLYNQLETLTRTTPRFTCPQHATATCATCQTKAQMEV